MEDFVTIATHFSLPEAEAERLALEAAGIRTLATDENIGEMLVPATFGGIKLQVAAQDAERAKQVLAELRAESATDHAAADDSDGVSLKCPGCGTEIWFPAERRGQAEVCPECGRQVDVPAASGAESQSKTAHADESDGVSLKCPACGAEIWFPSERRGHVEVCPECGSHVDVTE